MPKQVPVLNAGKPGNSLALWLALYAPDIFAHVVRQVKLANATAQVKTNTNMGRMGDDISDALDTLSAQDAANPVFTSTSDFATPIEAITIPDDTTDLTNLDPLLVTDQTSSGANLLNLASSSTTSSGTTVGSILGDIGTSLLTGLTAVGNALSQPKTLTALASTAAAYYTAQNNPLAAQVLQAQLARAANGQTALPITYMVNPATGLTEPMYATTLPNGQVQYTPVTATTLAGLTGPGVSSGIGVWVAAAAAVLFLAFLASRNRE